MLQNDASQTGSTEARNDLDVLAQCDLGPATGNAITGAGTVSGAAGADTAASGPATIVAVNGVESSGGTIQVEGAYGTLEMQGDGSYTYTRKPGAPDGVSDVFTYTLADANGARDDATLTIDIRCEEDEPQEAQNLVTTADGVVMLPAGVELSDIRVIGRDLVITLPDGSTMTIPGGAVFVPQLVIGDVEVPPANLAALLIEQEPQPASGTPQSSGGNFAVDVPPLDPGVPLGDLLPPTDFGFPQPVFEEVGDIVDRDPEILIQPEGQPPAVNAVDSVDEAGLPERNEGEPAGSGESADGNGANNSDTSETTTGVILVDSPDGPNVVTINGVAVTSVGQTFVGDFGVLTITSISDSQIGYTYTLDDNTSGDATHDDFSVTVTDSDGDAATATLTINIVDDTPIAVDDTDSIAAGEFGPATGNVLTDDSAGDAGDSDDGADTVGADDADLTAVTGFGETTVGEGGEFIVEGEFGVLTINTDGSYSYVRNPGTPGGVQDVFTYTLTDGDGDIDTATLTIDIGDATPSLATPAAAQLDDDALSGGNPGTPAVNDDPDAVNTSGNLNGSGGDGDLDFFFSATQGGLPDGFTANQVDDSTLQILQGDTVVLTVTLNNETGAYEVVQNNPIDHEAANLENNEVFNVSLFTQDVDGDQSEPVNLTINVDDDTPVIQRLDVSAPTLLVDETDLAANASGDFSTLFGISFGADGEGSTEFSLGVVNGTDSGLTDVATGDPILLFDNNGVIEGRVGGEGGAVAFTVSVDSETGVVTLDQQRALDHPDDTNPDDQVSPIATSIQLTITATDADGDPVSETINIGGNLAFDDDGPAEPTLSTEGFSLSHDETPGNDADADDVTGPLSVFDTVDNPGDDPHVAGAVLGYAVSTGAISVAAGTDFGADGEGTTTFGLTVSSQGVDSGLDLTDGTSIFLFVEGDLVVGRAGTDATDAADNAAAFALSIDADTGVVSMVQYLSIEHPNPDNPDESISIANDALLATATVTDGDNDPATGSIAIGGLVSFQDDAPAEPVLSTEGFSISHDETPGDDGDADDVAGPLSVFDGVANPGDDPDVAGTVIGFAISTGAIAVAAGSDFGADGPGTTTSFALAVSAQGVDSGLDLTDGTSIFLFLEGDIVVGRAGTDAADAADNPAAFAIAIDSDTGVVSMVQYLSIEQLTPGASHDEPITIANDALIATATVTDGDNDPATGSISIGGLVSFQDDGPDAQVADVATDTLVLDETTPPGTETDGDSDPAGLVSTTADFSNNFVTTIDYGADGPADSDDVTYSLVLTGSNVASGLFALDPSDTAADGDGIGQGTEIVLNQDPVTGVITGTANGQTYFTISINSETGVVTFTQNLPIWHSNTGSDDDTSTLEAVANSLVVRQTVTDGDGDVDFADIDLSSGVFQIEDDGPVARPDTDVVTTDGGSATGNVITDAHAGDTGDTDNGADDVGADAPGRVTFIDNSQDGAAGSAVPAGGFVEIAGEFGTLRIFSNGDYTYTRNDGLGGGESEVFTYTLMDADGDTTTSTLTITIDDETPVAGTAEAAVDDDGLDGANTAAGTNDINANTQPDPDDLDGPASSEATFSGQLTVSGGDGDIDFTLVEPADGMTVGQETVNFTLVGGLLTATIATSPDASRVGDPLFTVSLDQETGEYTVTLVDNILHGDDANNDEDGVEVSVDIQFQVSDADGDDSNAPGTLTIVFNDDVPVLANVTAGSSVTVDETAAGSPTGFSIQSTSAGAVITATQAFGADGAATSNSVVYGLTIVGGSPEPSGLSTAIGDHPITLVQIDSDTIEGQYEDGGTQVAFIIEMNADGTVTITQNVPLEHLVDGSSAAAHDDALDLDGLVDATITITDADGDSTSASAPIGDNLIFRDDGPDAQVDGTATLDTITLDESRPEGTDTPGGTTPTGDASNTADFSDNFVTTIDFGADGAGSVGYSLVLSGPNVGSGLFALDGSDIDAGDGDGYGQGVEIVLNQVGNTITGSAGGTDYFTITIDPVTGIVTFTQLNPIWHPTSGTSSFDEAATLNTALASNVQVVQTVTDSDGDTDTASVNVGQGVFAIQDDGPTAFDPDPITSGLENSVGDTATADLDTDGQIEDNVGEDQPGLVTFANISNGDDSGFTSNEDAIEYWLSNDGQTLQGRTNSTDGTDGELIFQIDLNQNPVGTDTYTITMHGTIDNNSGFVFDDLVSTSAGNVEFRGVGADDPSTSIDLLLSALSSDGTSGTVNTDSDSIGSDNQSMNAGETVRIDFVTNLTTGAGTTSGFGFDAHVSSNQFLGMIPQVQGNQAQTVDFTVFALDTTLTETGNPDRDPTAGFSDSTITEITEVTVIGFDVGESNAVTVDISGVADGDTVAVAYGITVTKNADGSVTFHGIQEGDQYGFGTDGGDFNAIVVEAHDEFDLGVFSIGTVDFGDPVNILLDLQLTDADGDTVVVTDAIDITVEPNLTPDAQELSTGKGNATVQEALVVDKPMDSVNDNLDQVMKSMNAANSNAVFLGAIAAAGIAATPAAAHGNFVEYSDLTVGGGEMSLRSFDATNASADRGAESMLTGKPTVAVQDSGTESSSSSQAAEQPGGHSVDSGEAAAQSAPAELPGGTEAPAHAAADAAPVAMSVAMPSAEALAEASVEAPAKSVDVSRVVADALSGGGDGPSIDALIDAAAGHHGQGAALEALAARPGADVSAWDMGGFGGFTAGHTAFTIDHMIIHPDAAPQSAA